MKERKNEFVINLPNDLERPLLFSEVCWKELNKDTGLNLFTWAESNKDSKDELDSAIKLSEVVFASAKAWDIDNGDKIDYTQENALNWIAYSIDLDMKKFYDALFHEPSLALVKCEDVFKK